MKQKSTNEQTKTDKLIDTGNRTVVIGEGGGGRRRRQKRSR